MWAPHVVPFLSPSSFLPSPPLSTWCPNALPQSSPQQPSPYAHLCGPCASSTSARRCEERGGGGDPAPPRARAASPSKLLPAINTLAALATVLLSRLSPPSSSPGCCCRHSPLPSCWRQRRAHMVPAFGKAKWPVMGIARVGQPREDFSKALKRANHLPMLLDCNFWLHLPNLALAILAWHP